MSDDDRATLAALLREHRPRVEATGLIHGCTCGWTAPRLEEQGYGHIFHVTSVLAAYVTTARAQAWDDGYEAGMDDGHDVSRDANPYQQEAADPERSNR